MFVSLLANLLFKFITKEAEMMCFWLEFGTYHPDHDWCITISIARRCALDFMAYKGPDSFSVAGLMMVCSCLWLNKLQLLELWSS